MENINYEEETGVCDRRTSNDTNVNQDPYDCQAEASCTEDTEHGNNNKNESCPTVCMDKVIIGSNEISGEAPVKKRKKRRRRRREQKIEETFEKQDKTLEKNEETLEKKEETLKKKRETPENNDEPLHEFTTNNTHTVVAIGEQNNETYEHDRIASTESNITHTEIDSNLEKKEKKLENEFNDSGENIHNKGDTGLLDIFCVQSEYNGHNQMDGRVDVTDAYVKVKTETSKTRKKKKRLPDIKKRSSKVAINHDLVLPPISSAPPPFVSPRNQSTRDDKATIVNVKDDSLSDIIVPESQRERKIHKEPLWICKLFCRFPLTSFVVVTLCHLTVFSTTIGLFLTGYDVFPIVFDDLPLYIHNDVRLKELTWRERSQVNGYIYRPVYGFNIATGSRSQVKDTVEVIFEKKRGNILNQHDLSMIKLAEDRMFSNRRFKQYFCFVDYYRNCVKPQSILRLFDGTYSHVDSVFTDTGFTNITEVIYKASLYNDTRDFLYLFLGKDSLIQPGYVSTSITRIFFLMGWPLGRMENNRYGTFHDLQMFLVNDFKSEIEQTRDHLEQLMDVYYLSKMMMEYDLVQQALKDILLAIGSISFIFVFMCFQTGSLSITFLGILSILSSFLWTNMIYRYVFQYVYFGFFHVIALFLILGIGIDDLFVFYDTWRLTGHSEYPSDAHRLSDCFRRAAKTTFVTSFTTMAAFLVSGFSPLLPVRTFGIFAGVLVGINYLWVIIYFPVIILLHHLKFKNTWRKLHSILLSIWLDKKGTSETERSHRSTSQTSSTDTLSETSSSRALIDSELKPNKDNQQPNDSNHNSARGLSESAQKPIQENKQTNGILVNDITNNDVKTQPSEENEKAKYIEKGGSLDDNLQISIRKISKQGDSTYPKDPPSVALDLTKIRHEALQEEKAEQERNKTRKTFEDRNRIVNFLKNGFFDFMTLRVVKFVIPVLFIGVSIFFIYTATLIEPDTHQLRLFRSTHNYAIATDHHYFSFIRNHEDEYQRLYLVWGLGPADIDYCNLKSGKFCHGKTVIDYGFDMETAEAQVAMKTFCESLKNLDPELAERLRIRRDTSTNQFQIACFTEDFETYFENEIQGRPSYPNNMNLSIPVTVGNVTQFMTYNSQIFPYSLPYDFDGYFQILLSYWMTNKYTIRATSDYFMYNNLLGEQRVSDTKSAYYTYSGTNGTSIWVCSATFPIFDESQCDNIRPSLINGLILCAKAVSGLERMLCSTGGEMPGYMGLYYGTRTLYVAVEINTTMDVYSLNYKDGLPIFREWEAFMDNINSGMPEPLQNGFQVTENLWHWIHVQEELANSAVIGILVGLFSAWPILVFTTMNFVIGTVAVVTIGLVTACVVGMIPLAGWKLGVLESINLCLVVGLSVDYVVHLAEAYRMAESTRRLDRVRSMLESIGLSIISGAITTMGAAVFMLFAQIQFFFQFGVFMISTVGISLMFSLFCFTTLMSLFGPQGTTGSLSVLCSCIGNMCCASKSAKKGSDVGAESDSCCSCCKGVNPLRLKDRLFDWISYKDNKTNTAK